MKEYRIEGIRNRFYWDGGDRVLVENLKTGMMMPPHCKPNDRTYMHFNMTLDSGQHKALPQGKLLAMLRTGCSLEHIQNSGCQFSQDGYPLDSNHYRKRNLKRRDVFRTLKEIDEAVDIIKKLNSGDPRPFYLHIEKNREYLRILAGKKFGIKAATFDLHFDEAVTAVEEKLRELRMRCLKKPSFYVLSAIRDILYRRGLLTKRQSRRFGL